MMTRRRATLAGAMTVMVLLVSCWGSDPREMTGPASLREEVAGLRADLAEWPRSDAVGEEDRFTLQLLHASDMDGSTGALNDAENFWTIPSC